MFPRIPSASSLNSTDTPSIGFDTHLTKAASSPTLSSLPNELQENIISFLPAGDALALGASSSRFSALVSHNLKNRDRPVAAWMESILSERKNHRLKAGEAYLEQKHYDLDRLTGYYKKSFISAMPLSEEKITEERAVANRINKLDNYLKPDLSSILRVADYGDLVTNPVHPHSAEDKQSSLPFSFKQYHSTAIEDDGMFEGFPEGTETIKRMTYLQVKPEDVEIQTVTNMVGEGYRVIDATTSENLPRSMFSPSSEDLFAQYTYARNHT